ncbi:FAS1 domain-containing protein [Thelonectria olida]|uniref:FAS1 domain-containing protein n=1 Tax=Thelonectria olida TaxID=1576542 RepID=A0A9P8W317_9HYPO|nr:FAS1 domain-containing protein [Thelonectria olida]
MRFVTSLTLATAASAFVITKGRLSVFKDKIRHDAASLLTDVQDAVDSSIHDAVDSVSSGANSVRDAKKRIEEELSGKFNGVHDDRDQDLDIDSISNARYDLTNLTIYQILEKSNHTKKFFKAVNKYDDIVKLLNDTEEGHGYTLFVPTDAAFDDIPEDHKKPSDEFIKNAIKYHIGLGWYPAGRILTTHTIPTAYKEEFLGDQPQRLRTSVSLSGVSVNVYSKVIAADFEAKNGVIHAVNHILVPPTLIGREISFFPAEFSTLLLAYEKTDFVKYVHGLHFVGSTVFAPSNRAWEKLGPAANAYLFNTEEGKKHLTALLKYQIVPNTTVYSDEIYYGNEKDGRVSVGDLMTNGHFHIQLPTLLKKDLSVDIYSFKLWTSIVVNGAVKVGFLDGIGKNGVIQVVEDIPVPHGKAGDGQKGWENIEVEELKRRLDQFIESDDAESEEPGEL